MTKREALESAAEQIQKETGFYMQPEYLERDYEEGNTDEEVRKNFYHNHFFKKASQQ